MLNFLFCKAREQVCHYIPNEGMCRMSRDGNNALQKATKQKFFSRIIFLKKRSRIIFKDHDLLFL